MWEGSSKGPTQICVCLTPPKEAGTSTRAAASIQTYSPVDPRGNPTEVPGIEYVINVPRAQAYGQNHLRDEARAPRKEKTALVFIYYIHHNLVNGDFQATISTQAQVPINRPPVYLNETAIVMGHKDHVNPKGSLTLRCCGPISTMVCGMV